MTRRVAASCVALSLLAWCGACSDGGGDGVSSSQIAQQDTGNTTEDIAAGDDAAAAGDDVPNAEDAGDSQVDSGQTADVAADAAADVPLTPDCPGQAGCECQANSECDTTFCIEVGATKKCAQKCVDTCPEGFACVSAGAGDVTTICAPLYNRICNPCEKSADCASAGLSDPVCVDYGPKGQFCGIACSTDDICPSGYECASATSVEGATSKQCVRKPDDASGSLGTCTCSEQAVAKKLQTTCSIENKNEKGEVIGVCAGTRACGDEGLSDCTGPPPTAELCDGLDNDCNGKTDEATCDDNNGCTVDACDPSKAGPGKDGCIHSETDGACDADGSVCTESDKCVSGVCTPGKAKACDDGNPCSLDACDAAAGCTATNDDGKACDDNNACTQGDSCKGGACATGKPVECSTADPCVAGKCELTTGKCAYKKLTAACDDNNPCTQSDVCGDGFCTGKPVACDDNNPCTSDVCKSGVGCTSTASTAPCDDNNKCTDNDGCADGSCVGIAKNVTVSCDDGNVCTTDSCNPNTGCLHAANAATCDDGNPCTTGDTCKDKLCDAGTNVCDCDKDADCVAKEDGDLCNGTLFCDKSKAPFQCQVNPKTVVTCAKDKDTACSTNTCDAKTAKCAQVAEKDAKPCDADSSVCTKADACKDGVCAPGAAVSCDDNNPCTDDSCGAAKGCQNVQNTAPCNADDNKCTPQDRCESGVCLADKKKSCDDGNSCTVDVCAAGSGACSYDGDAANGVKCDVDGSACTPGDACSKGVCVNGAPLGCDDNNVCTNDACDAKKGCVSLPNSVSCTDGDPCTTGDVCAAAKCESGKNQCSCQKDVDCAPQEDGNLCNGTLYCDVSKAPFSCKVAAQTVVVCDKTNDTVCLENTCAPKTGKCAAAAVNSGKSCNDGDACTAGDVCGPVGGAYGCAPGKPVVCDDKNDCTLDACDKAKGCTKTVDETKTFTCYGGAKGTLDVGECKSGKTTCQKDGSKGPCIGEVQPAAKEACNSKDDTCDGKTDTGCKPTDFAVAYPGVLFDGKDGKVRAVVHSGNGVAGPVASGGKYDARFGWLAWLQAWWGEK